MTENEITRLTLTDLLTILSVKLTGKKTYVTAAVASISAITTYLSGGIELFQALQMILMSVFGATIRSGLTTDINAAAEKITTDVVKK